MVNPGAVDQACPCGDGCWRVDGVVSSTQRDRSPSPGKWAGRPVGAGCRASLRAARSAWWGAATARRVQSLSRPRHRGGGHAVTRTRAWLCPIRLILPWRPVLGKGSRRRAGRSRRGEALSRRRHSGDVEAPAIGDAVVVGLDLGPTASLRDRLDGGPAHQLRALLGHSLRRTLVLDSRCLGVRPPHEHRL